MELHEVLDRLVYPSPYLLIGLMLMMFIDLLTGVRKAANRGEATTSRGFRNSFDKATTYFSLILSVLIIVNIVHVQDESVHILCKWNYLVNGLFMACIYIEMKSIFENLIDINTKKIIIDVSKPPRLKHNDFALYILIPLHNILIFKLKELKKINKTINVN